MKLPDMNEEVSKYIPRKNTDALLHERGATHGNFSDNARATQLIKKVIANELTLRKERGQHDLTLVMEEAIDLICTKLGRILTGNCHEVDHWDDIAGYARLVAQRVSTGSGS